MEEENTDFANLIKSVKTEVAVVSKLCKDGRRRSTYIPRTSRTKRDLKIELEIIEFESKHGKKTHLDEKEYPSWCVKSKKGRIHGNTE